MGQDDLFNCPAVMPIIEHIDPFSPLGIAHLHRPKSTPTTGVVFPHHTTFAVSVVGNFHAIPWLGD